MSSDRQEIYFKSPEHEKRFWSAVQAHIYDGLLDKEYGAALYILSSHWYIWESAAKYIDARGHGLDIPEMIEHEDLSSGYKVLVSLAGNLFNNQVQCNVVDFIKLDAANLRVAFMAMHLRFYGWSIVTKLEGDEHA
jgi:hypothetical protein